MYNAVEMGDLITIQILNEYVTDHIYGPHITAALNCNNYKSSIKNTLNYNHFKIVKILAPLDWHKYYDIKIDMVATMGDYRTLKFLLSLNKSKHYNYDKSIRYAIEKGRLNIVKLLVPAHKNKDFTSHVYTAFDFGNLNIIKYLVPLSTNKKFYFNTDKINKDSYEEYLKIIKYLAPQREKLNYYLEILNATKNRQIRLVKILAQYDRDMDYKYIIELAAWKGLFEIVKTLVPLHATKFDTTQSGYYDNAIKQANDYGHFEIVEYLKLNINT